VWVAGRARVQTLRGRLVSCHREGEQSHGGRRDCGPAVDGRQGLTTLFSALDAMSVAQEL
jgi:hypothetical protein